MSSQIKLIQICISQETLRMESKPSRIPRRISVQPSGSLSTRMVSGNRGTSLNDSYHSRDSSFRLDSEYQVVF
jgi:E3 ubiquitin-protein ligase MARCH7